jgi:hypothetical protein
MISVMIVFKLSFNSTLIHVLLNCVKLFIHLFELIQSESINILVLHFLFPISSVLFDIDNLL